MKKKQPFPICISEEKIEDHMNLLLIKKEEKQHYVLIKISINSCITKLKIKQKKTFLYVLFNNHKEDCITSLVCKLCLSYNLKENKLHQLTVSNKLLSLQRSSLCGALRAL